MSPCVLLGSSPPISAGKLVFSKSTLNVVFNIRGVDVFCEVSSILWRNRILCQWSFPSTKGGIYLQYGFHKLQESRGGSVIRMKSKTGPPISRGMFLLTS